jgi:hypothetical protein
MTKPLLRILLSIVKNRLSYKKCIKLSHRNWSIWLEFGKHRLKLLTFVYEIVFLFVVCTNCALSVTVSSHFIPLFLSLGLNWDKSFRTFPPCYSQSPLINGFKKKWFELVCNVNIVYGNLNSESSQDYA